MSEWQPIETAPRDRQKLLLAYRSTIGMVVDVGLWTDFDSGYPCKGSRPGFVYLRSRSVRFDREHQPTHWMKLPEPPEVPR